LLLYGYGLGYYGRVGPGPVMVASIIFAMVLTIFANFWVKQFRYGPFEWLWRGATYGKLPTLLISTPSSEPQTLAAGARQRK
jgi:uncharacterized protein